MRIVISFFVFLLIFAITSCSSFDSTPFYVVDTDFPITQTPSLIPNNQNTLQEKITPLAGETPEDRLLNSRTSYSFIVDLEFEAHHLEVQEKVKFTNTTANPLDQILLVVPPAAIAGIFRLDTVESRTELSAVESFELENVTLNVSLVAPIEPLDTFDFIIHYSIDLPEKEGVLGFTSKQTNLCDWYPFIPPYSQSDGWVINHPSGVGEWLAYPDADFEVLLRMGNIIPLIVASSAPESIRDGHKYFAIENARNISFSISPVYTKITQQIGNITINGYLLDAGEESGNVVMKNVTSALIYYGDTFGAPYHRSVYSFVEADFPDGMEYDGLFFLSGDYFKSYKNSNRNYLTTLAVHETAHQWWYAAVGNDQAKDPWLDEALCTYSELLFYQYFYPEDVNWWWENRVQLYAPTGDVNSSIYDHPNLRSYINAVYLRGAMFLHEVRSAIGDEAFLTSLRSYANFYDGKIATSNELLSQFSQFGIDAIQAGYFSQ